MRRKLLLLFINVVCFAAFSFAQQRVTGIITSSNDGAPVSANIKVKGTNQGTSSGSNGAYTLNNVSSQAVLVVSALGFQSQEISVRGRSVINISMQTSDQNLDEVIVVAYGTSTKGTYTGSASTLNADKTREMPVTTFQNALTGRLPGVQVTSASGQAGSTPSIRIRGIGSINASNEPLYVIDGVPIMAGNAGQMSDYTLATVNVMNTINPADIETITVLKDAAASSLYGSRAANGVILITTKRGKTGAPKIDFRTSLGLTPTWATDNYEAAGVQEQVNMLYRVFYDLNTSGGSTEAAANTNALSRLNTRFNQHGYKFTTNGTGLAENVNILGMTDGLENREGRYFDWNDALFRTAQYQTNDLAVSGGSETTTYYSSFSYTKDQGRVNINEFDRYSGRINLSQKIGKYLEAGTNVSFARSSQTGFNDTRNTGSNYFMQTRNLLWPFYWPTDYKTGQPFTARFGSLAQNNVYYDNQWDNNTLTKRIIANQYLQANVFDGLTLKTLLSYDNSQVTDHIYYSALHYNGQISNGTVSEMMTNYNKLVSSSTANYSKMFGVNSVSVLAGFETEKNVTDFQRATGADLGNSALQSVSTAGTTSSNAYGWGNSLMSVFSRLEYNYNQRYFLSGSIRKDGASKLSPSTRWGTFWSVAGSWRISEESFMKDINAIDNMRIRASYGTNGTLPGSDFGWRELTSYTVKYLAQPGGLLSSLANPGLNWESSYSTNLALEFGLFKYFTGTIEYFNKDTKNLLLSVPISMTTGFGSALRNIGEVNNRGLEVELNANILNQNGFKWDAGLNISFIKSKVTKLYVPEGETKSNDIIWNDPTGGDARAQFLYQQGRSMLSFYGFEWGGVNPANGKNVYYKNGAEADSEDIEYQGRPATEDFNKASRVIIGDGTPDAYGGINTELSYNGFSLGLVFNYKIGGQIYDGAYKDVADDGYYWERIRAQSVYDNMWTPENRQGTLPKLDGNDLTDPMQYSSRQLHDASFLRLKNLVFAYALPKNVLSKIGVANARLYFNGSNLLTFAKYKEADPEVGNYSTRGWETPFGKTYTFGLDFSF